jgi:hypothetical protein
LLYLRQVINLHEGVAFFSNHTIRQAKCKKDHFNIFLLLRSKTSLAWLESIWLSPILSHNGLKKEEYLRLAFSSHLLSLP